MPLLKISLSSRCRCELFFMSTGPFSLCAAGSWKALNKQAAETCRMPAEKLRHRQRAAQGILFLESTLWTGFCDVHGQDGRCAGSHCIPLLPAQRRGERAIQRGEFPASSSLPQQPEAGSWPAFPLTLWVPWQNLFSRSHPCSCIFKKCIRVLRVENGGKINFPPNNSCVGEIDDYDIYPIFNTLIWERER